MQDQTTLVTEVTLSQGVNDLNECLRVVDNATVNSLTVSFTILEGFACVTCRAKHSLTGNNMDLERVAKYYTVYAQ